MMLEQIMSDNFSQKTLNSFLAASRPPNARPSASRTALKLPALVAVTLTLGVGDTCKGTTDSAGAVSCSITPRQTGTQSIVAEFPGDVFYLESSDTQSFEIVHDVPRYIVFGEKLMGIKDRKADLQANMQQSLERLKRVVEGSA